MVQPIFFISSFSLIEADLAVDLGNGFSRDVGCLFGSFSEDTVQVSLVLGETVKFRLQGSKGIGTGFADGKLEITVAFSFKFAFYFFSRFSGEARVDVYQIVNAGTFRVAKQ